MATPPTLGPGPWLYGAAATNMAFAGPSGISYAAVMPDVNTGPSIWSEDMLIRAIRTCRHMCASRLIAPHMPWAALRHYSDEELQATGTCLHTLPPMTNHVAEYLPPSTLTASAEGADRRP